MHLTPAAAAAATSCRCLEVQEAIWAETFKYMADNKVMFEGILLKPAMVTPGADSKAKVCTVIKTVGLAATPRQ